MSNSDEDDYLANLDKFLVEASTSSAPKTYSQRRRDAEKKAKSKNEQNRIKSRRQREMESRAEGLSKSLFERAKEEEDAGLVANNKALGIMMKMGFKPGQALGRTEEKERDSPGSPPQPEDPHDGESPATAPPVLGSKHKHNAEPLPVNEWAGKQGIGLGTKRAAGAASSAERVAKMAKMAADSDTHHRDFRNRAKQEYEERRAEGRLAPAQRTCVTLDAKAGKTFNVFWLNPHEPDSLPPGLFEALDLYTNPIRDRDRGGIEARLRRQMAADALVAPHDDGDTSSIDAQETPTQFPSETLEEASHFLRLQAPDRLQLVLSYLRDTHSYCFWCGTQYDGAEEMRDQCPGEDEQAHD